MGHKFVIVFPDSGQTVDHCVLLHFSFSAVKLIILILFQYYTEMHGISSFYHSVSKVSVLIFYLSIFWTYPKLQVISFEV